MAYTAAPAPRSLRAGQRRPFNLALSVHTAPYCSRTLCGAIFLLIAKCFVYHSAPAGPPPGAPASPRVVGACTQRPPCLRVVCPALSLAIEIFNAPHLAGCTHKAGSRLLATPFQRACAWLPISLCVFLSCTCLAHQHVKCPVTVRVSKEPRHAQGCQQAVPELQCQRHADLYEAVQHCRPRAGRGGLPACKRPVKCAPTALRASPTDRAGRWVRGMRGELPRWRCCPALAPGWHCPLPPGWRSLLGCCCPGHAPRGRGLTPPDGRQSAAL